MFEIAILMLCIGSGWSSSDANILTHWTYEGQSDEWLIKYPTCKATEQSPINLNPKKARQVQVLYPKFDQTFHRPLEFFATNNGHSITFRTVNGEKPIMKILGDQYRFEQFHFHWGLNDGQGSEHMINGRRYPLEGHFLFSNSRYESLATALGNPRGVLVVGVLYKPIDFDNLAYVPVIRAVYKTARHGTRTNVGDPIILSSLLPKFFNKAYVYRGSLTTPPCTENVIWVVNSDIQPIGEDQLQAFRYVENDEGHHPYKNFRKIQRIGERKPTKTFF